MYMLADIIRFRWLKMLREPDKHSRLHLHLFIRQVAFVVLCSLPALLIDRHRPALFLLMMRGMFGFSALGAFGAAVFMRRPVSSTSLCIWDHAAAMLLITVAFSLAIRLLHFA
jgi:hypothetical protein